MSALPAGLPESRTSLAGLAEPDQMRFVMEVLDLFAFENCSDIWWRTDGSYAPVTFLVNCSDSFWWACADAEAITPENLPVLREAFADARAASEDGECDAALLFAARVRGMRPQGAVYKHLDQALWPLFDAAGPPRETGLGNPTAHPTPAPAQVPSDPADSDRESVEHDPTQGENRE